MRGKLVSVVLAACLVFAAGARPCAAWMAASQPDPAHDCCKKPSEHSHEQESKCELLCALAGSPFASADKLTVETQKSLVSVVPVVADSCPLPDSTAWTHTEFRPPDHAPPLFLLHAAFLI